MNYARASLEIYADPESGEIGTVIPGRIPPAGRAEQWGAAAALARLGHRLTRGGMLERGARPRYLSPDQLAGAEAGAWMAEPRRARVFIFFEAGAASVPSPTP